jgi:lysophospholipase L1-like esterase
MRIMNRLSATFILLMGLALLPGLTVAAPPAAPATANTNGVSIVCLGDSLTYGSELADPETQSYPAKLQGILGPGWLVHNEGHPGTTCLANGDKPLWQTGAIPGCMALDPQVVIILLGTNDAKEHNWQLADQFASDYSDLTSTFANMHTHPKVWLCTPLPVYVKSDPAWDARINSEVIPKIRAVGKKLGLPVIDLYTPFVKRADLFPDGLHPNAEAAAKMADIIAHAIQAEHRLTP